VCFSPPGFHVFFSFLTFFHVTHDGLSERGTIRSLVKWTTERIIYVCVYEVVLVSYLEYFFVLRENLLNIIPITWTMSNLQLR